MKSILKPREKKTDKDIRTLERIMSYRHKKSGRRKIFFGEFISPNKLLSLQPSLRLDLIVRDLAVGHLLGENTIGLKLWEKLGGRTRIDYQTRLFRLQILMKSFEKNGGYDAQYPIPVNGDYKLLGGAHRMVLSKRYKILEVPIFGRVGRTDTKGHGSFDVPVMKKLGYTDEEMEYILGLKDGFFGIT